MAEKKKAPGAVELGKSGVGQTIANRPPPASVLDLGRPVGVPEGFTVNVPLPKLGIQTRMERLGLPSTDRTVPMPSIFYENDLHGPVAMGAADRRRLNQQMYDLGLFGSKRDVNLDMWSDDHMAAYAQLLYIGNTLPVRPPAGLTEKEAKAWQRAEAMKFLRDSGGSAAASQAAGRAAPPPLTVQLTSDKDLKRIVDDAAVRTRGRRLTSEEAARFVAAYHGEQRSAQSRAYSAQTGPGGTVQQETSEQAAAEAFIQEIDPLGVEGKSVANAFNAFQQILTGGGS